MRTTDTRIYPFAIPAGGAQLIQVTGENFLVRSTSGPVNVRWDGGYLSKLNAGQGYRVRKGFNKLALTNDAAVPIVGEIQIADDDFIDNNIFGTVGVRNGGTYVNSNPAVATASGVLVPANPLRTYLLIQNNDGSAVLSLNFSAAASMTNGLLIQPGGYYESLVSVHTGAVNAIASAATTKIIVVEG